MISKQYRLRENEVKKVLAKRKPFFSHHLVANASPNTLGHARIGIVLSGKQAPGSVNRNSYRRLIYDGIQENLDNVSLDIVFVCRKGVKLDHKDLIMRENILRDSLFILRSLGKPPITKASDSPRVGRVSK